MSVIFPPASLWVQPLNWIFFAGRLLRCGHHSLWPGRKKRVRVKYTCLRVHCDVISILCSRWGKYVYSIISYLFDLQEFSLQIVTYCNVETYYIISKVIRSQNHSYFWPRVQSSALKHIVLKASVISYLNINLYVCAKYFSSGYTAGIIVSSTIVFSAIEYWEK